MRQDAGRYEPHQRRLGRLAAEDPRDRRYPARAVIRRAEPLRQKYWWGNGWWGDQGDEPECVDYSGLHIIEDDRKRYPAVGPEWVPGAMYRAAQKIDEWPGEDYDGTSVRAGAKVLRRWGYVAEYRWAFTLSELIDALLYHGPVWLGTNWYRDMFEPDLSRGALLSVTGPLEGGHAYVANGINLDTGLIRIKNSWGRSWGTNGLARMRLEDADRLLGEWGEACVLVERRPG